MNFSDVAGRSKWFLLALLPMILIVIYLPKGTYKQGKDQSRLEELRDKSRIFLVGDNTAHEETDWEKGIDSDNLRKMIEQRVINRTILISVFDSGYVDTALNLWETSYVRFNITNYLFVCLSKKAQKMMEENSIPCFLLETGDIKDDESPFGTMNYNVKVMMKTKLCLHILKMGYNTMIVDVDIVFFQNPMPYMTCEDCDLIIQNNTGRELNTGFYLIKPTRGGLALQKKSLDIAKDSMLVHDQLMMNKVLRLYLGLDMLVVKVLDVHKFQPGCEYFRKVEFASEAKNDGIVMVHNNWIVGIHKKTYRVKEMLLWEVDRDGYYSNDTHKYLTYKSPPDSSKSGAFRAYNFALQLGIALQRFVILPQFTCVGENETRPHKCNFVSCFGYPPPESLTRESVFLDHHKVPDKVRKSVSPVIHFNKTGQLADGDKNSIYIEISKKTTDIKEDIVMNVNSLGLRSYSVLQFGSLKDVL